MNVNCTSIGHSSSHDFELDQMAKGSKKEFPFLENKNNYHFQHDNSRYMKVLLHGTTATRFQHRFVQGAPACHGQVI